MCHSPADPSGQTATVIKFPIRPGSAARPGRLIVRRMGVRYGLLWQPGPGMPEHFLVGHDSAAAARVAADRIARHFGVAWSEEEAPGG